MGEFDIENEQGTFELEAEVETTTENLAAPVQTVPDELQDFTGEEIEVEVKETIEDKRLPSIVESLFFAAEKPISFATLKTYFEATDVTPDKLKSCLDHMLVDYQGSERGISLEEVAGGFQLRTKASNVSFIQKLLRGKVFRLSGPALEVLSIVAYKQPVIKAEIDQIRGVESGHLLRSLMERGILNFEGRSELPGKPMQYGTTKKFLEIFNLRSIKELPTLSQIDELLPEGMLEEDGEKQTLSDVTEGLSSTLTSTYSDGEDELLAITEELGAAIQKTKIQILGAEEVPVETPTTTSDRDPQVESAPPGSENSPSL